MAGRERRGYVIFRWDGLLLRTKPITREEARWLLRKAYYGVDLDLRIRYLAEWGNVLDVNEYLVRLRDLDVVLCCSITGRTGSLYEGPGEFTKKLNWLLSRGDLRPEVRQILEEFAERVGEFLRRPVEPKPIVAPVRYFMMPARHVALGPDGVARPRPEWLSYRIGPGSDLYGISVFRDSIWLWEQYEDTEGVAVRRDARDEDVVAALANDRAVRGFLKGLTGDFDERFKELLRASEAELIDKGYGDVARKVKVVLGTLELLCAGRRMECWAF